MENQNKKLMLSRDVIVGDNKYCIIARNTVAATSNDSPYEIAVYRYAKDRVTVNFNYDICIFGCESIEDATHILFSISTPEKFTKWLNSVRRMYDYERQHKEEPPPREYSIEFKAD